MGALRGMDGPRVSVIIPTFNRAEFVVRAVRSALEQTVAPAEVIVVDDGSRDHTPEVLAPFGDRIVRMVHDGNQGVSAARNTGLRRSRAPLVAFLDSDDYWLPRKLAVQVSFFRDHPEAVACQTEEVWIRRGRRVNPGARHRKPSGDIFGPSLELCLVSPSAVMLKRDLFREVGLFDERLPACEDYDLWLRIACRYPVYRLPEALVIKEGGHPDQLSRRYPAMDRYRIRSLARLISSGLLDAGRRAAAVEALGRKAAVYAGGCFKRGKAMEGIACLALPLLLSGTLRSLPAGPCDPPEKDS